MTPPHPSSAIPRLNASGDVPFVQPTMAQTGDLLVCSMKWRTALAAGAVRAYVDGSTVTIENETGDTLDVPLTGTEVGNMYGGTRSGWLTVAPGLTVVTTAEARTA